MVEIGNFLLRCLFGIKANVSAGPITGMDMATTNVVLSLAGTDTMGSNSLYTSSH